jgi:hypothetical protein
MDPPARVESEAARRLPVSGRQDGWSETQDRLVGAEAATRSPACSPQATVWHQAG